MKKINLTRGFQALVDDEDYEWLNQWKWYVHITEQGNQYAVRDISRKTGKRGVIYMHKLILSKEGFVTDHKDRDSLNNQRGNLRLATKSQDSANKTKYATNKSGYKGVYLHKPGVWRSRIMIRGKVIDLGLFSHPKDAAIVYEKATVKYYGEFARI